MAKQTNVISHWYQLIEGFETSALGFYQLVEEALARRHVPSVGMSRVDFSESGLLAAKREYLRFIRGKYTFDICAAPFGTGFFFSSWLTETKSRYGIFYLFGFMFATYVLAAMFFAMAGFWGGGFLTFVGIPLIFWLLGNAARNGAADIEVLLLTTPIIGFLYEKIFSPVTFYNIDTALMFQESVQNALLEVIDSLTAAKGIRALSELERKPILKRFAQSA